MTVFGYNIKIVPTAEFGSSKTLYYKIGYLDGNNICIAKDCADFINNEFKNAIEFVDEAVYEAIAIVILKSALLKDPDLEDTISTLSIMLRHRHDMLASRCTFGLLIEDLKKVCDKRTYDIPKEYF